MNPLPTKHATTIASQTNHYSGTTRQRQIDNLYREHYNNTLDINKALRNAKREMTYTGIVEGFEYCQLIEHEHNKLKWSNR